MAERERDYSYYEGNTVKTYSPAEAEPVRRERETKQETRRKKAVVRRNRAKAHVLNKRFTTFLVGTSVCILLMCAYYLSIQTQVIRQAEEVAVLKSQLNELNDENNATTERLKSLMDLDYIYKVATKKLHMVYAGEDQIYYYEGISKDYIRQYGDIPQE